MKDRASWRDIWCAVADNLKDRSLCDKAQVGAVIVDASNTVVSTGYNGPPAGFKHEGQGCNAWCPARISDAYDKPCWAVHAEANAILSGDRSRWEGGAMYCTKHPCWDCTKLIANSGLVKVVVKADYDPRREHVERYAWLQTCGIGSEVL